MRKPLNGEGDSSAFKQESPVRDSDIFQSLSNSFSKITNLIQQAPSTQIQKENLLEQKLREKERLEREQEEIEKRKKRLDYEINQNLPVWTVLFFDLCSSSRKFALLGDLNGYRIVTKFRSLCLPEISKYEPTHIDLSGGDQILACFHTANQCVDAALQAMKALENHNATIQSKTDINYYICASAGIHMGKVIYQQKELHQCHTLNFAKRLQDLANQNQIIISEDVRNIVMSKPGYTVTALGSCALKNIPGNQNLYELRWHSTLGYPSPIQTQFFPQNTGEKSPEVTYSFDSPVSMPTSKILVQIGNAYTGYDTIEDALKYAPCNSKVILRDGTYNEPIFINRSHITLESALDEEVIIQPESASALEIANAKDVVISGISFSNPDQNYIPIGCVKVNDSENITFIGCDISETKGIGCAIQSSKSILLQSCTIHDCDHGGVTINDFSDTLLDSCKIFNNGQNLLINANDVGYGVSVRSHSTAKIHECNIENNRCTGIYANNAYSIDIEKNRINYNGHTSAKTGICLENGCYGNICGNEIIENGSSGIILRDSHLHVKNNSIRRNGHLTNPKQAGIVLIDSHDSTIASSNILLQNGEEGFKKYKKRDSVENAPPQETDSLPSGLYGCGRMARSEWVDKYNHQKIRRDKYRPK